MTSESEVVAVDLVETKEPEPEPEAVEIEKPMEVEQEQAPAEPEPVVEGEDEEEKDEPEKKSKKAKNMHIASATARLIANRANVKIIPKTLINQIQEYYTDLVTRIGDKAVDLAESAEKKTVKTKHVIAAIRDVTAKTVVPAVPMHKESGSGFFTFQTPIRKLAKNILQEKCEGVHLVGEEAVSIINSLVNAIAKPIVERAADNAMGQDRQTIKPDDICIALSCISESKLRTEEIKQSALRILFPDGKVKSVDSVRDLQLVFPKGRVERLARTWYDGRWAEDAHIYLSAILQSIVEDIIFLGGQEAAGRKKQTLKGQHVYTGIKSGEYAETLHKLDLHIVHGAAAPTGIRTPGKRSPKAAKVMQQESTKILVPHQTFRRILKIVATGNYRVASDAAVTMQLFIENYIVKVLMAAVRLKLDMAIPTIRLQPNEMMAIVDLIESW